MFGEIYSFDGITADFQSRETVENLVW